MRIELDQGHALDARVLEDLADRHAVAAADHEHAPRLPGRRQRRMHQRLVIAVLVARVELQVAVEEQAHPGVAAGDDDPLVGLRLAVEHVVGVEAVLGPAGHPVGEDEGGGEGGDGQGAGQRLRADPADLAAKQPQRPDRDAGVEQAEERAGADQPELRHEQQRKGDRDRERAEVVEGQHLRHQRLQAARAGAGVALEDAHDERNLEPDQDADDQHQGVEGEAERGRAGGLQREQRRRHQPADQADEQLDAQEVGDQLALEPARQPRADAHGEQVGADDGRELEDRVAEQVAGERAGGELVDQPAGGDDEDRGEERDLGRADRGRRRLDARSLTHPCTAAATIMPMAIAVAPTTIASATFFFSTISSHRS